MTIKVGDKLPETTFRVMTADGPAPKTTGEVFDGRKVVLFAVPGAFTPTCSNNHLPGFLAKLDEIKAKGVDHVAVTAVNDVFVMNAWAKASEGEGKIEFLADGSADLAKALGLELDATAGGLGVRSKRYAMIVNDGTVEWLAVEDAPGKADATGADAVLAQL
ncbi:MAG TPA: peroxiredoxin [Saliniramus sp.]|nr:peroxiredoxin [Saliniramus sp.]